MIPGFQFGDDGRARRFDLRAHLTADVRGAGESAVITGCGNDEDRKEGEGKEAGGQTYFSLNQISLSGSVWDKRSGRSWSEESGRFLDRRRGILAGDLITPAQWPKS